jgi:hypothetical protein
LGGGGLHAHRVVQDQRSGALHLPEGCADKDLDPPAKPDRSLDAEALEGGDGITELVLIGKSRPKFPATTGASAAIPGRETRLKGRRRQAVDPS